MNLCENYIEQQYRNEELRLPNLVANYSHPGIFSNYKSLHINPDSWISFSGTETPKNVCCLNSEVILMQPFYSKSWPRRQRAVTSPYTTSAGTTWWCPPPWLSKGKAFLQRRPSAQEGQWLFCKVSKAICRKPPEKAQGASTCRQRGPPAQLACSIYENHPLWGRRLVSLVSYCPGLPTARRPPPLGLRGPHREPSSGGRLSSVAIPSSRTQRLWWWRIRNGSLPPKKWVRAGLKRCYLL